MQKYRIFLSSPGDVTDERDTVSAVVDTINALHQDADPFELIRWEDRFYTAQDTFQSQLPPMATTDLVICVFWKQLGTELPDQFRRVDGTVPTGSEFEFEEALKAATESPDQIPDILVYRKTAPVVFTEEGLEQEQAQREKFLSFWRRWFRSEKGQFLAAFHTFANTEEFKELIEEHLTQWLNRRANEVTWTQGSPFRGLRRFEFDDAPIFFGRYRETERVRARLIANALSGKRFLLVSGPSGSGKSSLIRAGLLPRLTKPGGLSGLAELVCRCVMTPSELRPEPDEQWQLGLAKKLFDQDALGQGLEAGDFATPRALSELIGSAPEQVVAPIAKALERLTRESNGQRADIGSGAPVLVLVVDQIEELFSWPDAERDAFVNLLSSLATADPESARIFVIAAMRSDFRHRCTEIPPLEELAGAMEVRAPGEMECVIEIGLPTATDLRDMILGPARAAGLTYERLSDGSRDLAEILEREAQPGSLPQLQCLLSELYNQRDDTVLTLATYDSLGGVAGVMANRGEATLARLDTEATAEFPRLARALVQRSSFEVSLVSRSFRVDAIASDTPLRRLIDALVAANLLAPARPDPDQVAVIENEGRPSAGDVFLHDVVAGIEAEPDKIAVVVARPGDEPMVVRIEYEPAGPANRVTDHPLYAEQFVQVA